MDSPITREYGKLSYDSKSRNKKRKKIGEFHFHKNGKFSMAKKRVSIVKDKVKKKFPMTRKIVKDF